MDVKVKFFKGYGEYLDTLEKEINTFLHKKNLVSIVSHPTFEKDNPTILKYIVVTIAYND